MPIESLFSELGEPSETPWCLTFANTVSPREGAHRKDGLQGLEDLRAFMARKAILAADAASTGEDPRNFERAIRLREAIFGLAKALSSSQEPSDDDISELNWNVQRAIVAAKIEPGGAGLQWDLDSQRNLVAGGLGLIALSAAGLFTSERAAHVRLCGNPECQWLFLDLSKNHSRKWCDMASCGNVAKARRYYAKQKLLKSLEPA